MCGIAGLWRPDAKPAVLQQTVEQMAAALRHRGPDHQDAWVDAESGLALGHRRLSIIDLSASANQPMHSPSRRFVIVFNGEIYNFRDLRRDLDSAGAPAAGTHSDTEVILAAAETWGVVETLRRLNGMFALALWDRRERRLHLARDRFGEKPLYYGWSGNSFVFASELKAIAALPGFARDIDRDALALYLRHNCIPAPYTVYRGIRKLGPGEFLSLSSGERNAEPQPYWSLRDTVERARRDPFRGTEAEAITALDELLRDSVRMRMISDVPLGAFLSGGIDSTCITALMQAASGQRVRTFTIGMTDAAYDEAADARQVAAHLGTDHTELLVTPAEAMAVIPDLPRFYDEPFSDSSQIPTYLVSRMARRHVTVALSGDGGDEIFAGYNRHSWVSRIWRTGRHIPRGLRKATAVAATRITTERWDKIFGALGPILPSSARVRVPGFKVHKLAGVLGSRDADEIYLRLASHWSDPGQVLPGACEPPSLLTRGDCCPPGLSFTERMVFLDTMTYLPDDILAKVDRASMAVSLETRVPFLDPRVVEFAWRLPMDFKIREGKGKWILRQVAQRYVPQAMIDRPKMGFGIPLGAWLRGPLRDWAESLLDPGKLAENGIEAAPVRSLWARHVAGDGNWEFHLWDVLMLQAWMAQWAGDRTPAALAV